jgi:hypothetical protein
MVRMIRLWMVSVGLAVTGVAWAQEPAHSIASLQQDAAKKSIEWNTLAAKLEQRVARLLPCDRLVRGAVEEARLASEARTAALTAYWTALSDKSRNQTAAIQRLLAQEEARKGEWTGDRAEAEQDRVAVAGQIDALAQSAHKLPALAAAQQALTDSAQAMRPIETQIQERENTGDQFASEGRDLLAAAQARQRAIDAQLNFIAEEGLRWNSYYAARLARAQTECAVTGGGAAGAAEPAPRSKARKAPARTEDTK